MINGSEVDQGQPQQDKSQIDMLPLVEIGYPALPDQATKQRMVHGRDQKTEEVSAEVSSEAFPSSTRKSPSASMSGTIWLKIGRQPNGESKE